MVLQAHPEFSDTVNQYYTRNINRIQEEVDELLIQNKQNLNTDEIMAQALSIIFFKSLKDATNSIYFKSPYKKTISAQFDFSNYIDYMINNLEQKDENGPFLATNFIKKINSIHDFPKTITITYDLCLQPSGLVLGYSNFDKDITINSIKDAYRTIVSPPMQDNIKEDIQLLNGENTHANKLSKQLTHNILQQQLDNKTNIVHYHFHEFKQLLQYASSINIDKEQLSSTGAINLLTKIHPHLIDYNEQTSHTYKIK